MAIVGSYPLSILCIFLAMLMAPADAGQMTVVDGDEQLTLHRENDSLWRVTAAAEVSGPSLNKFTLFIDRPKWQLIAVDAVAKEAHVCAITDVLPSQPDVTKEAKLEIDFFGAKYTLDIERLPNGAIFHFKPMAGAAGQPYEITATWK